jgi:hypothetical protein
MWCAGEETEFACRWDGLPGVCVQVGRLAGSLPRFTATYDVLGRSTVFTKAFWCYGFG